jgi:hypothetical protein
MAFLNHFTDDGRIPSHEYLPCSAMTPRVGMALVLVSGVLVAASGTTKPTYICQTERIEAVEAGELIPVNRVLPDMAYETTFSASASSVKVGDKVTLAAGGEQVTATTTDGIAEVISMEGTAAGSKVIVRFP